MHQERKQKRTFRVERVFEPDRIAPVNLRAAYERIVPPDQYRIFSLEQRAEKLYKTLHVVEEASA